MKMNGRLLMAGVAVLLLAVMAVLVVKKAREEAGGVVEARAGGGGGQKEDYVSEEILRAEKEGLEAGKPITPERAHGMLRELGAEQALNLRARKAGEVIRDLCVAGYADEAWEMVDSAAGPVREMELTAYFHYVRLKPLEMLAKMKELPRKAEVHRALDGYLSGGTLEDIHRVMQDPEFVKQFRELEKGYPVGMRPVMAVLLEDRMQRAQSDEDRDTVAKFARSLYELKAISGDELQQAYSRNAFRDVFERWAELQELMTAEGGMYGRHPYRSEMLLNMIITDSGKLMEVLKAREDQQGLADLAEAVRIWLWKTPDQARKWLEQHMQEFSPAQQERIRAVQGSGGK